MADLMSFRLHELEHAPEGPGIYSWYYVHELSDKDIHDCLRDLSETSDGQRRRELIRRFLDRYIFRYYGETPYDAKLSGPLKPRYSGRLDHEPTVSSSLLDRLAEGPARLPMLKHFLKLCVPHFASPIYIGVAISLRTRLIRHKALIQKFLNARGILEAEPLPDADDVEAQAIHSFARDVCVTRRFVASNLSVYVMECPVDDAIRFDVENLLNRINYPLCGRN